MRIWQSYEEQPHKYSWQFDFKHNNYKFTTLWSEFPIEQRMSNKFFLENKRFYL